MASIPTSPPYIAWNSADYATSNFPVRFKHVAANKTKKVVTPHIFDLNINHKIFLKGIVVTDMEAQHDYRYMDQQFVLRAECSDESTMQFLQRSNLIFRNDDYGFIFDLGLMSHRDEEFILSDFTLNNGTFNIPSVASMNSGSPIYYSTTAKMKFVQKYYSGSMTPFTKV